MSHQYRVKHGESPTMIARRFGVSPAALVAANPHKATAIVAGQRTWRSLGVGEPVIVPGLGAIAPSDPGAPHGTIRQGSRGPDVALWQTIIGSTADGIFGPNTAALTKTWQGKHGLAADGIVGPKTWAAALGGASAPTVTPVISPSASTPSAPVPITAASPGGAHGTIRQGSKGPDVALWQTIIGTTPDGIFGPNTATATKAWQSSHGLTADGIVGPQTWAAALGGAFSTPAAMPTIPPLPSSLPSIPSPVPLPTFVPSGPSPTVTPTSVAVPAAVQGLSSIDPCYSGNNQMVCAAQHALGVTVDGKYGASTAAAMRKLVPNAPAPCSPRPSWWKPTGQSNCTGSEGPPQAPSLPTMPTPSVPTFTTPSVPTFTTPVVVPSATPSDPGPTTTATSSATTPGGPAQPVVVAPEKKGLSTGAMVAGALGVAALVGVVAVAASGKKGARGARGATRRSGHKKPRKSSHKKRR